MTTLAQPVTQYFQIREGLGVARADEDIARAGLRRAEQEVDFGVLQAYAGVLIAQRGMEVARERVVAAELRVGYQAVSVSSGTAIDANAREARVRWLQGRQDLLEREGEFDDLTYKLADALGLPPGTRVELRVPGAPVMGAGSLEDFVADALRDNPDVMEARALVSKTTHGVGAARAAYIPQVGILGGHVYQTSLPFFPKNMLAVGIVGSMTVFDFGARRNVVQERRAQLSQAEQNLEMIVNRVRGEVEAAHRRLTRAAEALSLAQEALELRTEGSRLRIVQAEAGYAVPAQQHEATAERLEAEMDLLRAQFGYRIAQAELGKASGSLGR
jgi:outer membrane protein TolC